VIVAVPIRSGETLQGALLVVLPQATLREAVQSELHDEAGGIIAYDRRGALIASAIREIDPRQAAEAASLALVASRGSSTAGGLIAERVSDKGEFFQIVAVTSQRKQADIGLRSALILLAPVLGAALSFAVVWLVLDLWVLRWFYRLQDLAHDFGAGRYTPIKMEAAPSEIADLATAFGGAVTDVRVRQQELTAALGANKSLTRELHHRVKNNLQVLSSLISRQQRRAPDPAIRDALGEARARMAPVALVYRFINPPEELTGVDLAPYLTELARQLHVALAGEGRGVKLEINVPAITCSADDTTNIGLIVAETMITGYANAIGAGGAEADIQLATGPRGTPALCVKIANGAATGREADVDHDLIVEVARQLGAEVQFEGPSSIVLVLKHEPAMDEV
jgi:two-component sensor histidine kinase